jgi:hypothetical protein
MQMFRKRPSPALVVAIAALVVAMAGTGYAATQLPKNSVGNKQLKKNAVTSSKVKNKTLKLKDLSGGARNGLKGDKGDKGDRGLRGASGATNVRVRKGTGQVSSGGGPNPEADDIASCNPGERAVGGGGGWSGTPSASLHIGRTEPAVGTAHGDAVAGQTPNGWFVEGVQLTGTNRTLTAYVICAAP